MRKLLAVLLLAACASDPTAPAPKPDTTVVIADPNRPSWNMPEPAPMDTVIPCPWEHCIITEPMPPDTLIPCPWEHCLIIDSLPSWGLPQPVPR